MDWNYKGTLVRVIDGDTLILRLEKQFDAGFRQIVVFRTEQSVRVRGIDAPEMVGESRPNGLATRDAVVALLAQATGPLDVVTHKGDSFGRWLADVWVTCGDQVIDLAKHLLDHGLAVPYRR